MNGVWLGSCGYKNTHCKDTCQKGLDYYTSSCVNNYSTLNKHYSWEDYIVTYKEIHIHASYVDHN